MDLTRLPDRLLELPDQGVRYYEGSKVIWKSYPEVHADLVAFTERLTAAGVKSEMRIGIIAENCYPWILFELAMLQIGCVSVCFPPEEFTRRPTEELIREYGLHLLILSANERKRRSGDLAEIMVLEGADVGGNRVRNPEGVPEYRNAEMHSLDRDVLSLVFSSGTSGKIKCLLISRCGTEEILAAYGRNYTFRHDDGILVVLPLSNFQQRLMVYAALLYGFDILMTDPLRLFKALIELRPTIVAGPPMFYELVEGQFRALSPAKRKLLSATSAAIRLLPSESLRNKARRHVFAPFHRAFGGRIRLLLTGSAPSRMTTLRTFQMIGLPLYQVYGLTETMFVSWNLPGANRLGSVGRPVYEGSVELADDGEIIVHQDHPQSLGYIGVDEEEARRTFLPGNRIATGDLGRFDSDGWLYIIGRKKAIIVTQGGYKVHPEILERPLEESPDIARAVVFGGNDIPGIVALVSLRPGVSGNAERRVQTLIERINSDIVSPARISRAVFTTQQFTVENQLLTRNLKVDRHAVYRAYAESLKESPMAAGARR